MKKIITSALVVMATTLGFSQKVTYGVKGGLNISDLSSKNVDNSNSKVGINFGGFAEVKLNDKFAVQPEIFISTQGATLNSHATLYDIANIQEKAKIKLTYLNIPIMLKYQIVDRLNVELGPQIGIALSGEAEISEIERFNGNVETDYYKINLLKDKTVEDSNGDPIKEYLKNFDFSLNFGLSYDIINNFFVNARYNLGLTNITNEKNIKVFNRGFQVGVGYKF